MATVYILTREENQYDQFGEYFVDVFANKPTKEQLQHLFIPNEELEININHLLEGGGRRNYEDTWYYLREKELK
jgi:hypothetical protein